MASGRERRTEKGRKYIGSGRSGLVYFQDLMTLTVIASGVLALRRAESPQGGQWLIRRAPMVDPIPRFPMYRLLLAVASMIVRVHEVFA